MELNGIECEGKVSEKPSRLVIVTRPTLMAMVLC